MFREARSELQARLERVMTCPACAGGASFVHAPEPGWRFGAPALWGLAHAAAPLARCRARNGPLSGPPGAHTRQVPSQLALYPLQPGPLSPSTTASGLNDFAARSAAPGQGVGRRDRRPPAVDGRPQAPQLRGSCKSACLAEEQRSGTRASRRPNTNPARPGKSAAHLLLARPPKSLGGRPAAAGLHTAPRHSTASMLPPLQQPPSPSHAAPLCSA